MTEIKITHMEPGLHLTLKHDIGGYASSSPFLPEVLNGFVFGSVRNVWDFLDTDCTTIRVVDRPNLADCLEALPKNQRRSWGQRLVRVGRNWRTNCITINEGSRSLLDKNTIDWLLEIGARVRNDLELNGFRMGVEYGFYDFIKMYVADPKIDLEPFIEESISMARRNEDWEMLDLLGTLTRSKMEVL